MKWFSLSTLAWALVHNNLYILEKYAPKLKPMLKKLAALIDHNKKLKTVIKLISKMICHGFLFLLCHSTTHHRLSFYLSARRSSTALACTNGFKPQTIRPALFAETFFNAYCRSICKNWYKAWLYPKCDNPVICKPVMEKS